MRGGRAKLESFPALKAYLMSANRSHDRETVSGGVPSASGTGSKACGIDARGNGAKAKAAFEHSLDGVMCSGSLSHGEDGRGSVATVGSPYMPGGRSPPKVQYWHSHPPQVLSTLCAVPFYTSGAMSRRRPAVQCGGRRLFRCACPSPAALTPLMPRVALMPARGASLRTRTPTTTVRPAISNPGLRAAMCKVRARSLAASPAHPPYATMVGEAVEPLVYPTTCLAAS